MFTAFFSFLSPFVAVCLFSSLLIPETLGIYGLGQSDIFLPLIFPHLSAPLVLLYVCVCVLHILISGSTSFLALCLAQAANRSVSKTPQLCSGYSTTADYLL
ncbi:hypothetical protein QBC46DRAFT_89988 [Diplogelasinospora grovesii]|uniref:Uncharacterized protein n=1 Tax=Diplogelasinospora grovesii TaxID=303347 RepID=A0AAN6N9X4_9PEZI|nr:hypothetical protein QBC46DRAFT_89988 [Diplogelasinospora grovesii]